jgi:hypothetical protein
MQDHLHCALAQFLGILPCAGVTLDPPRGPSLSMTWADSGTICARRQVTTDPRPRADDPHQPPSLIIDLTQLQPFNYRPSLGDQRPRRNPSGAYLTCYLTSR